jgi:mannose-6-phosphate isomerase-like protein (cupin superfamily)
MHEKMNLAEKLGLFTDHWNPRIIADVNDHHVKLAKLMGAFDWHRHAAEDEFFLVISGRLRMHFRDREVVLEPGECIVVPHGVEHRPVADVETHVLLFEPASTLNTGTERTDRTRERLERI